MRLKDRIAIVTGAASGFGRAIAEAFAREGAQVTVADMNEAGARHVAAGIGAAAAFACDVSRKTDVDALVAKTVATFGGLDIVVNNAGTTHRNQSLLNVTEAEFDLAPFRGSYCRIIVVDEVGRRAWGNPIWP